MRIIDSLIAALRGAANYSADVQVAPFCILWPDKDRQFECVIPRIQIELPELFVLGDYAPEKRLGPGIWLRCALAGKLTDIILPVGKTPILYLPGISRQDLRAVENCPDELKPLAELQYRGSIWSQVNSKDCTILAFLKSMGLEIATDLATKDSMRLALSKLLDEEIEPLQRKRLDKDYFNALLTGGDWVREALLWLNQCEAFRSMHDQSEWKAFVGVCKSKLQFDPETDGPITGATRLAAHEGAWEAVWNRFCEAPKRYPNIPGLIRKTTIPDDLFLDKTGWPQWNETEEKCLRNKLLEADQLQPEGSRKLIEELETNNKARRSLVWAELGESPLAQALEWLEILAQSTANPLTSGTLDDVVSKYCDSGWQADWAVLKALACVEKPTDFEAVSIAIRALYLPWAQDAARYLQNLFEKSGYVNVVKESEASHFGKDECVIFVDGLRFDVGRRLSELLAECGHQTQDRIVWAALPTITATSKPAVTPVSDQISGQYGNHDFEPCVAKTGQSLKGGYHLRKLMLDFGWQVLEKLETGTGKGRAWSEFGNIDHEGHDKGWKLAKSMENMLNEIVDRIKTLLDSGWKNIRIVTDHGWLLAPGGLPHVDLPACLTENKWGRFAAIKAGAKIDERLFPWRWNQDQLVALANGISCYRKGETYAHGGLSFQECLTLEITVSSVPADHVNVDAKIMDVVWRGMRLIVTVDGDSSDLRLDIRLQPGNPDSSVARGGKPFKENGTGSVVVEDDDLEGTAAAVIVLDNNDQLVAQFTTLIGRGDK
jgi:hypothetical protein